MNRLLLKDSRLNLSIWLLALVVLIVANVVGIAEMINTQALWDDYVKTVASPVGIIFTGPGIGLKVGTINLGAAIVGKLFTMLIIAVAIMNIIFTVNWNRGFEENGQTELLVANPIRRHSLQISTLFIMSIVNLIISICTVICFISYEQSAFDSVLMGVALFLISEIFIMLALISSAVFSSSRTAKLAAIGSFIALYCVGSFGWIQGVQESGLGHIVWWSEISPVTWVFQTSPFVDNVNYTGIITLSITLLILASIALLIYRVRDMNASLIQSRSGRESASKLLTNMFTLRFRLSRTLIIGWGIALALLGFAYGSLVKSVVDMIENSPEISQLMNINEQLGKIASAETVNTMVNYFIGYILVLIVMIVCGFSISRVHGNFVKDEANGVYEMFYSAPMGRIKYFLQNYAVLLITLTFSLFMGVSGFIFGIYLVDQDLANVLELYTHALQLSLLPIFFVALAVLLFAINRRLTNLAWIYFAYSVVIQMFGSLLKLPDYFNEISIFKHFNDYPIADFPSTPFIVFASTSTAFCILSLFVHRYRDIR